MRVAVDVLRDQPDQVHQLGRPAARVGGRPALHEQRVGDDPGHRLAGVEGGVRVLEDHLEVAAQRTESSLRKPGDVPSVEGDAARGGLQQPHQHPAGGGLPTARLAHQAEGFARRQIEGDPVDGAHGRPPAPGRGASAGEGHGEIAYGQQRIGRRRVRPGTGRPWRGVRGAGLYGHRDASGAVGAVWAVGVVRAIGVDAGAGSASAPVKWHAAVRPAIP